MIIDPSFSSRVFNACEFACIETYMFDVSMTARFSEPSYPAETVKELNRQYEEIAHTEEFLGAVKKFAYPIGGSSNEDV